MYILGIKFAVGSSLQYKFAEDKICEKYKRAYCIYNLVQDELDWGQNCIDRRIFS